MSQLRPVTVSRWAAALIFVTVALGSMVCTTDSSSACPAWPACYPDKLGPELAGGWLENPVIEFIHRAISFLGLVLLGWAGWLGRKSPDPRVRAYPWLALICGIGSAVFGMLIILAELPLVLSVLDLFLALVCLLLITVSATATSEVQRGDATTRLALSTFVILVVMHLLGAVVAGTTAEGTGSFTRCLSWPLWRLIEIDRGPTLQILRMLLAVVALLMIGLLALRLAKRGRRPLALTLVGSVLLEQILGLVIVSTGVTAGQTNGISASLAVAYSFVAVLILWLVAIAVGLLQANSNRARSVAGL